MLIALGKCGTVSPRPIKALLVQKHVMMYIVNTGPPVRAGHDSKRNERSPRAPKHVTMFAQAAHVFWRHVGLVFSFMFIPAT